MIDGSLPSPGTAATLPPILAEGEPMSEPRQYHITWTNQDGRPSDVTLWSRFLPTTLAVLAKCGAHDIRWTTVK